MVDVYICHHERKENARFCYLSGKQKCNQVVVTLRDHNQIKTHYQEDAEAQLYSNCGTKVVVNGCSERPLVH